MTNLFQPLDVSVNKAAKAELRKLYGRFYTSVVQQQLADGVDPHEVKVDTRISVLKPLQAEWIVKIYNRFQTEEGKRIILSGFRRAHIAEAFNMKTFPCLDPFANL